MARHFLSHHEFTEKTLHHHIFQESGCPNCRGGVRLSIDKFIEKAEEVHGKRYDYSQVEYVNNRTHVTIVCRDHGPFPQDPGNHIAGKGCPDCGGSKPLTTKSFVEKAAGIHGNRYDYSQVEYVNGRTNVTIICPDHGPFQQAPETHIIQASGCPDCGGTKRHNIQTFIEKAEEVHGQRYDYSQAEYANNRTHITIICPDHGPFEQTPHNHLRGRSCPDCAETGFNPSEPGTLYYIAVTIDDGNTLYKIGITNNSIHQRFAGPDLARIRLVKEWRYYSGRRAAERESQILRQYAGERYFGPNILRNAGTAEMFTHDVLGLDE
jgi:rubrerythrin